MNDVEVAICSRIRQFREHVKWSQAAFATELGISRDKLASIESGRTPLRYDLAERICGRFKLSEVWLAGRTINPKSLVTFDEGIRQAIPPGALFSVAFSQYLWPKVSASHKRLLDRWGPTGIRLVFPPAGQPPSRRYEWPLLQEVRAAIKAIPPNQQPDFCQAILKAMDHFCAVRGLGRKRAGLIRPKDWPKDRPVPIDFDAIASAVPKAPPKNILPECSEVRNVSADMKSALERVLDELGRLTKGRGMKARLAESLGVPQARVSEWLAGKYAPSGEMALQLRDRVEHPERWTK